MRRGIILALAALLTFALTGVANAQELVGDLVFAHEITAAGAPSVDVRVTGADGAEVPVFEAVAPGTETAAEALPEGDYTVSITLAGTDTELATASVSIVAGGVAIITAEAGAAGPVLAVENVAPAAAEGTLSFAHFAGGGDVDVYITPEGADAPQVLFEGLSNDEAGETPLPVGTHTLSIYAAGTQDVLASAAVTINENLITIVTARADGDAVVLTVKELDQADVAYAVIRHGYPEGPTVDVYLLPEGSSTFELMVASLAPGEESEPYAVPPGDHRVVAVDVGANPADPDSILAEATFTFVEDSVWYLTFTDELFAEPTPTPSPTATATATPSTSPTAIRTPSRVETGAGGAAEGDQGVLVVAALAGLVALTCAGALVLGRRSG
jgi:hypothetical protein